MYIFGLNRCSSLLWDKSATTTEATDIHGNKNSYLSSRFFYRSRVNSQLSTERSDAFLQQLISHYFESIVKPFLFVWVLKSPYDNISKSFIPLVQLFVCVHLKSRLKVCLFRQLMVFLSQIKKVPTKLSVCFNKFQF